ALMGLCYFGVPLATFRLASLARRPGADPQQLALRVVNWLSRHLVWRRVRNGRRRSFDLRGAALGMIAATLALLAAGNLLSPVRMRVLAFLVEFRGALIADG